jgi:hypothetical protein
METIFISISRRAGGEKISVGWTCQRALTVRNNAAIDIVTCSYSQTGAVAADVAQQIAGKVAQQWA